jgi:cytidine deaminase
MNTILRPPEAPLRSLIDACRETLLACANDLVKVAAGVLDGEGRVFTAVQVRSRNCTHCSVCAEAIAIGMALTAGSKTLAACVSLVRSGDTTNVWSPCGSCRELLHDHEVGYVVVSDKDGHLLTVPAADLLPWP